VADAMSFFDTGNPVPSNDPRDLDDNAMHIDEIVNSTELTFTDRLGTERKTLAGIEQDADAILLRSDLAESDGSDLVGFIAAGTGADERTLQEKCRELGVSVTDYMTPAERADALTGSPVLDHSPAFTSFIAQVLVRGGRGRVPKGTYKLFTNVVGNFTQVVVYDEGVVVNGPGILFGVQLIVNKPIASIEQRAGAPDPNNSSIAKYLQITNTGGGNSYGTRQDYFHTGLHPSGFSLGKGNICRWDNVTGGACQAEWVVATSPTLASGGQWGMVTQEHNPINRGPDNGYVKTRGSFTRWAGGIQMVPEAIDIGGGTGMTGRNIAFSFCTAHSGGANDLGFQCKSYNGLLIEIDSIAGAGRGVLASGDTSGNPVLLPTYAMEIDQRWAQGIYTRDATFTGNIAINLGDSQSVAWGTSGPKITGNSSTGVIGLGSTGSGPIEMNPGGTPAMKFAPVASTVNFFSVSGRAAGFSPAMLAAGSDANINFTVGAKGTGRFQCDIGSIAVSTAGKGLEVKEGANAKQGVVTLVAGSVVVANTSVTATSRIFLTGQQDGGTPGFVRVSARSAGTNFTITSSNGADTSIIAYQIFEPA
jgi:hypothetical protein